MIIAYDTLLPRNLKGNVITWSLIFYRQEVTISICIQGEVELNCNVLCYYQVELATKIFFFYGGKTIFYMLIAILIILLI